MCLVSAGGCEPMTLRPLVHCLADYATPVDKYFLYNDQKIHILDRNINALYKSFNCGTIL